MSWSWEVKPGGQARRESQVHLPLSQFAGDKRFSEPLQRSLGIFARVPL